MKTLNPYQENPVPKFNGSHSVNSDQCQEVRHNPGLLYEQRKHYLLFEIKKIIAKRKPKPCLPISNMNTEKCKSLNVKNKIKNDSLRFGWLLKNLLISNHILCLQSSSDSDYDSIQ